MKNVLNPEVRVNNNKKESFFEYFKSLHLINKLFFISLCFLFIAIATDFKTHLAIDFASIFAVCSLIKGRLNIKRVLFLNWPLFALVLLAILKPYADNFCSTFGIRAIRFFFIGLAAELHLSNVWHYSSALSSVSITFMLFLFYIGVYNPENVIVSDRLTLTMHPNAGLMGYIAFCALAAAVCALFKFNKKEKLFLIPALIGSFSIMLLSATQTSLLGFIFCFIFLLNSVIKNKNNYYKTILSLGLIFGLLLITPLGNNLYIVQRVKLSLTDKSVFLRMSGRDYIWKATIDLFKEHPIIGTRDSHKEFENYINNLRKKGINPLSFFSHYTPHSMYLGVIHYFGLLGFILCFFMFFYSIKNALKYKHLFFMIIIIYDLTAGFFDYNWLYMHGVFFTFFPMGSCFARLYLNNQPVS